MWPGPVVVLAVSFTGRERSFPDHFSKKDFWQRLFLESAGRRQEAVEDLGDASGGVVGVEGTGPGGFGCVPAGWQVRGISKCQFSSVERPAHARGVRGLTELEGYNRNCRSSNAGILPALLIRARILMPTSWN